MSESTTPDGSARAAVAFRGEPHQRIRVGPGRPRRWLRLLMIVSAMLYLVVLIGIGVPAIAGAVAMTSYKPDTIATPESAASGAAFAGFPATDGLQVMLVRHSVPMDEVWSVVWAATPEAVDGFLAAGGLRPDPRTCSAAWIPEVGTVSLAGCQERSDDWRNPDGRRIGRRVTTGTMPDGVLIVWLEAFGP